MARDMSKRQFRAALKRHGIKPRGFLGYHDIGNGTLVSALNAGSRRRDQLAYLLRERDKNDR